MNLKALGPKNRPLQGRHDGHLNQAVTKDGEDNEENKYFGLELSELDTKNEKEESKEQNSDKHKTGILIHSQAQSMSLM